MFAVAHIFPVEPERFGAAQDSDLFQIGELPEAAGLAEGLKHGSGRDQAVLSGSVDSAIDIIFLAVNCLDRNIYFRVVDVLRERLFEVLTQLNRGEPAGLQFADHRHADFAVGAHDNDAGKLRLPPDADAQNIFRANDVVVNIDTDSGAVGRGLPRRTDSGIPAGGIHRYVGTV